MEYRYVLGSIEEPHLWTRELAREHRTELLRNQEKLLPGDVLVIDAHWVKVFDFSFAAEFFGKSLLSWPKENPGRFLIVENLAPYAKENLELMLLHLNLSMIERVNDQYVLLGKVHASDVETFDLIAQSPQPVAAADLRDQLGISINAVNERLNKLVGLGVIRRDRAKSTAGREQFLYQVCR